MARQLGLGEADERIYYLQVPIRINGSEVSMDLTIDTSYEGDNCFVVTGEPPEGGQWIRDEGEGLSRAWDYLAGLLP